MRASLVHELARVRGGDTSGGRREILETVRQDLEDLLNERSICGGEEDLEEERKRFPLVSSSVFCLGTRDPRELMGGDLSRRELLCREIELAIRRFEPRLRDVDVRILAADELTGRSVVLEIRARLVTVGDTREVDAAWRSVVEDGEARLEVE